MEFTTSPYTRKTEVDFAPATLLEEIDQNIRTILTTAVYSVPLDRLFGIDPELLDNPTPIVRARLSGAIVAALQKFEPRVKVLSVKYETDEADGIMKPIIKYSIKEVT